jgi:hypothetical protein
VASVACLLDLNRGSGARDARLCQCSGNKVDRALAVSRPSGRHKSNYSYVKSQETSQNLICAPLENSAD